MQRRACNVVMLGAGSSYPSSSSSSASSSACQPHMRRPGQAHTRKCGLQIVLWSSQSPPVTCAATAAGVAGGGCFQVEGPSGGACVARKHDLLRSRCWWLAVWQHIEASCTKAAQEHKQNHTSLPSSTHQLAVINTPAGRHVLWRVPPCAHIHMRTGDMRACILPFAADRLLE